MSGSTHNNFIEKHPEYVTFFILLSSTFFMWGFLTCNNTILVPHAMNIFQLSYAQAQVLNFSFFGTYLIASIPLGKLVHKMGYKNSIIVGLIVAGYACTLFGPACTIKSYNLFVLAMIIMGIGITLLQVAANPYITLLSFSKTAASRLTLQQGFNSLGSTMAPILGYLLFYFMSFTPEQMMVMSPEEYRNAEAILVQLPYMGLATVLFLMALAMYFSKLPEIHIEDKLPDVVKTRSRLKYVLQFPHLYLGVIAIFLYVGAEVGIGKFLISVLVNPNFGGIDYYEAPKYITLYWAGAMIGRFIGAVALQKIETGTAIAICATLSILLLVGFMLSSGIPAVTLLILVGLANSLIFPCLFTLGVHDMGRQSEQASSLLIVGIFGGAVIPQVMSYSIDIIGLQYMFIIPVICYAFIIYYGLMGSKIKN